MQRPKRILTSVASFGALSLVLAGCGFGGDNGTSSGGDTGNGGGEAGGESTTINLLVPSYSDSTRGLWEDVISGFESENDGYSVNLEVVSWDDLDSVVTTRIQGNQAPDILNGGPFTSYANDGLLYTVEEVVSEETLDDFTDSFIANASVEGTQYGTPLIASARALFVNNDLLEQAGAEVPTTWDELKATAEAISNLDGEVYGYGMPLGSEEAQAEAAIWFYGGGGGFGDDQEITIDTPENVAAAEFMRSMIDAGATQPDAAATNRSPLMDIFVQGSIGMQIGLPPTVGQIEDNNPDLDYQVAAIPTQDGSPFTLGVADHLMAFKNDGSKQDAIRAFLDYFYTADVYTTWVEAEGFLPTTDSGNEAMSGNEEIAPFLELLPAAEFYPSANPAWQATDQAFKTNLGLIATEDPASVLADIQAAADAAN